MKRTIVLLGMIIFPFCQMDAQNSFDEYRKRMDRDFESFKSRRNKEYEEFRKQINDEYAQFVRKAWREYNAFKGVPAPIKDNPIPPIFFSEEDEDKPIEDKLKPIDIVIPVVKPEPQPKPVVPIEETPRPVEQYFTFSFHKTLMKVRLEEEMKFTLKGCSEKVIAQAWQSLTDSKYNNVINDCLNIRSEKQLCDWGYLMMLNELSVAFYGKDSNESTLFTAFLYCQSGYKMRLASADKKLYMLYASDYVIYDKNYWDIDGEKYYPLNGNVNQLYICEASFPKEQPLSLWITQETKLAENLTNGRTLKSERYPQITATVQGNRNLIDFYNSYPTSQVGENFMTRWAMYANTPLAQGVKESLYPSLRGAIQGKSPHEAANMLLNFVQTAFVYEYDDKVWGDDRAFFAEETLFYPYADCEDRSILFSRLVRDLLGLKVVLVYYPGHLATAVHFTDPVTGDYILLDGQRFTVCDPTYIGAPVGATMPDMDNGGAKVILLE